MGFSSDSLTFHKNDLAISDDNMFFEVTERINHEEIYDVLDKLTDIEKYIVKERFGLDGDDFKSLKEVGEELGICYEGVRKNEAKALHKIRACYYRKLKYMLEIYEYKEDNSYQIKEKIRGRK